MYIHLHTICLTGVTELGTVTIHLSPNWRRFHWSISRWIFLLRKNIFGKKFPVELKFICAEFQIFLTFSKHAIIILEGIFHGNRSLTSYSSILKMSHTGTCGGKVQTAHEHLITPALSLRTLKIDSCNDVDFAITDVTGTCRNVNLSCR